MKPAWISNQLFKKALQQFLNNLEVEVIDFTKNSLDASGESFCSDLFRTTITYRLPQSQKLESIPVIVKRAPESKEALRFTEELNYFKKEIEMFEVTLPELHRILGDSGTLSARSLYAQMEPFPVLIIEDVTPRGYKMLDRRREGLDLEHCLCVVKKLAQFHAASLVLHNKNPQAYSNYRESMFWGKPIVLEWIKVSTDALIKTCNKSYDLKKYAIKLQRIGDQIPERAASAVKTNNADFKVLNHGDPWTSNFLFSYDNNKRVKDMILVDYQVVVYGSPSIDLHYLWATTPTTEVRHKHIDTALCYYYRHLRFYLEKLDFTPRNLPTFEELKNDWIAKAYYGFVSAITAMPLVKCDKRQDANWDSLLSPSEPEDGGFLNHIFNNPVALEHIKSVLLFYDGLNVFDY